MRTTQPDVRAALADWCRFFERRPIAAYGTAVVGAAAALALDAAVGFALPGFVGFATLYPVSLAVTVLGGYGPGLATLLSAALGGCLMRLSGWFPAPWSSATAAAELLVLAVAGGALVALGTGLRRILVRLLASEERLRLAIRSTGLGTWELDGVTGSRRWSGAFRAIIGLDRWTPADPELFAALIHPDDRDRVNAQYRAAHDPSGDGWYRAEFRIRRVDDGTERWVAATGRMFFDSAGKLTRAAGTILDITSRRHAEAALRESEERYRTLVETAPDAVNVQRDGVIIVANQQAAKLFGGRVPEDIVGRTAISLVDDASVEAARARTIRLSSTGQPNPPLEMTMRRLDGSTVEVEAASALIVLEGRPAIQAVLRDITERKRHERALRESETRFRLAAAAVQGIVYDVDLLTGAAWRSDGLERILGTAPDAVPGTASWWVERIHPEDVACIAEDSRLLADPGVSHLDREYRVRHARGHWVHLHDRSFVVRDKAGRALRLIGVATDISERKAAEAQQALLAREVDHRARNVLAVVQSLVRLTRAADPSEFKRAVEGRVTALARVHSLLAENRWRGTELRRIVEEELAGFRDAVAVEVTGPAVSLRAEAAQPVAMVLHELVTNAAKHGTLSTVSGQLRVSWRTNSDGWLQVCWDETGGPQILAVPEPVGFGSTLIEAMLGQQLGGHIRRVWRPQGLRCEFAIPPDRLAEPGG